MNVTMISGSLSRNGGGVFFSMRGLVHALRAVHEMQVTVMGLADAFTDEDRPVWAPVDPQTAPVLGPGIFGYAPQLAELLASRAPDLVHSHGIWMYPSLVSKQWSARTGRPHVVSPHGMLDPWALRNSAWKKKIAAVLFEGRHLRRAACLHALCEAEVDAIRAYGLKNPVCVIPNGVDVSAGTAGAPSPWNDTIPEGAKVLLHVGRMHPKKGLVSLLLAWSAAIRRESGWHLVLAGWDQGGHEQVLRDRILALDIADTVHLIGPSFGHKKEALYEYASAFVLPSLSEGLPMTVLEAWAHGLPVLMTPQCNLPEGFESRAAIQIHSDPSNIADGLRALTTMSAEDRRAMGQRGCELVSRRFEWSHIANDMAAVYRWVLGGGQTPACVRMS